MNRSTKMFALHRFQGNRGTNNQMIQGFSQFTSGADINVKCSTTCVLKKKYISLKRNSSSWYYLCFFSIYTGKGFFFLNYISTLKPTQYISLNLKKKKKRFFFFLRKKMSLHRRHVLHHLTYWWVIGLVRFANLFTLSGCTSENCAVNYGAIQYTTCSKIERNLAFPHRGFQNKFLKNKTKYNLEVKQNRSV